jgi:MFS family permease
MKRKSALFSMTTGMFIMPVSALAMASGNLIHGNVDLGFMSVHPIALMMIVGIVFQGLAESFISPRFLEFFSLQAPKGEEAMYLGFSHLHSFISSILGFGLSGYLPIAPTRGNSRATRHGRRLRVMRIISGIFLRRSRWYRPFH